MEGQRVVQVTGVPAPGGGWGRMGLGWEERPREKSRDTQRHPPGPPRGVGTGRRVPPGGRATAELKALLPRATAPRRRAFAAAVMASSPLLLLLLLLPPEVPAATRWPSLEALPEGAAPCQVASATRRAGQPGPAPRSGAGRSSPPTTPRPRRGPPGAGEDATRGEGGGDPLPNPTLQSGTLPYFLFPFAFSSGVRVPPLPPTPSSRNSLLPPRCTEHQLCTSGARIRVPSFRPGEGIPD